MARLIGVIEAASWGFGRVLHRFERGFGKGVVAMRHLSVALPGNAFGQPVAEGAINIISLRAAFIVI
jgi:hypothetical protein